MRLLALVPARGGSKRILNKNIRDLGGKPLISWTIEAAHGITEIADILVSTDSATIAQVAEVAGALVPWLRPPELATDTATSIDVCMHALDWYEKEKGQVDGLILLQPTSPFRSTDSICRGIDLFRKRPTHTVVAFSPAESHPMWCYRINGNSIEPFNENHDLNKNRSQDLPLAYVISGALYIASSSYLRHNLGFLEKETSPLIIEDPLEAIDIDTEFDWNFAEQMIKYKYNLKSSVVKK